MKTTEHNNPFNRTLTEFSTYKGETVTIKDAYANYFYSTEREPVKKMEFIDINRRFNKFLMKKVQEGHEVTFPQRLGFLRITGKKQKAKIDDNGNISGLSPNWRKTKELWDSCEECKEKKQLVYNTNEHSSGVRYRYTWSKNRSFVQNKLLYTLVMSRENKREVHRRVLEGQEYVENVSMVIDKNT